MKKLIALTLLLIAATAFAAEEKKVCVDKVDNHGKPIKKADGTVVQDCKVIKIHKKLEVEDQKK